MVFRDLGLSFGFDSPKTRLVRSLSRFSYMQAALLRRALTFLPILHICLWVLLPSLLEGSLRLDAAEGMTGGAEWQLSYPKHPPFSEWLTAIAWYAGPLRYWALFLIAQLLAVGAVVLIARWTLKHEKPEAALLVIFAGLASPFATYIPIQLNHNIGVMPFWALTIITAWFAFNSNKLLAWAAFGLSVGLGVWAKYSVLHLVAPLGLVFLVRAEWRRHLMSPGPWLAAILAILIVTPHFMDVWSKNASTLRYAIAHVNISPRELSGFAFNMALNSTILLVFTSIPFVVAAGVIPFVKAARDSLAPQQASSKDLFLAAAAFGPALLVILSPAFGVRPRPLWITPMIIPFACWLGHVASKIPLLNIKRAAFASGILASLLALGYSNAILIPIQNNLPQYSNLDARKLSAIANDYWRRNGQGELTYIVTTDARIALHAAGSIAFDLPHRVHVFEAANTMLSPWIDPDDVKKRGALVIGTPVIPDEFTVAGAQVTRKESFERPVVRGRKRRPIVFGIIEPQSAP